MRAIEPYKRNKDHRYEEGRCILRSQNHNGTRKRVMLATPLEMEHAEGLHPRTILGEAQFPGAGAWIGTLTMLSPLGRALTAVAVMITVLCDLRRLVADAADGIEVATATTGGGAGPGLRSGGVVDGIEAHLREQIQMMICHFLIGRHKKYLMCKSL
jgi:hypothetical protein